MHTGKIKKSFQDQSNARLYMNEGIRIAKMDYATELRNYKLSWWANFFRGSFFSSIVLIPVAISRFRYQAYKVPIFHQPDRYISLMSESFEFYRHWRQLRFFIPAICFGGWFYANWRTYRFAITDEYFERKNVKLPY